MKHMELAAGFQEWLMRMDCFRHQVNALMEDNPDSACIQTNGEDAIDASDQLEIALNGLTNCLINEDVMGGAE